MAAPRQHVEARTRGQAKQSLIGSLISPSLMLMSMCSRTRGEVGSVTVAQV